VSAPSNESSTSSRVQDAHWGRDSASAGARIDVAHDGRIFKISRPFLDAGYLCWRYCTISWMLRLVSGGYDMRIVSCPMRTMLLLSKFHQITRQIMLDRTLCVHACVCVWASGSVCLCARACARAQFWRYVLTAERALWTR